MVLLEQPTSTAASTSLPTNTAAQEESSPSSLSFSELLRGAGSKTDKQGIDSGVVLLETDENQESSLLSKSAKPDTLLSLLKTGDALSEEDSSVLNASITEDLSSEELKSLVKDAKNYLTNQIVTSDGFKKSEVESLPKTLKGLVQVGEKYGIDVSSISLDEINTDTKLTTQTQVQIKNLPQLQNAKQTLVSSNTTETTDEELDAVDSFLQESLKVDKKATPLFQAEDNKKISTEQLVQTRASNSKTSDTKNIKQKSDDTLERLLRGEKSSKSDLGLTSDFSVNTARVIAPQAVTESTKNLESLLKGDESDSVSCVKNDAVSVQKADSLEVKMNEAKQMTKYLSQDVKTAIDDYKSPFTRVKVQLNPQNLGEVDVTIVQRGKNLHINLSSNNAAINTLALNANDLKAQLTNNGINNATLNFNNNSQSSDSSFSGGQQQQNSQQGRDANREYNYFENEEQNEEMLSSLEIVVPYYA